METYCSRHGYPLKSVRFVYEGESVKETDTPESLKMEDDEVIETMIEQQGGGY